MKLQDWHEREMQRNPGYAKAVREEEEQQRRAWMRHGVRLQCAEWLGEHLPFRWIPFEPLSRRVNNRLARFMWDTPGFDFVHDTACAVRASRVATGKGEG